MKLSHPEGAEIGHREGAALQQVGADGAGLGRRCQLMGAAGEPGDGEPVGAGDHRDHQTALGIHRERQVHVPMPFDAVAGAVAPHHGVELRKPGQGARHREQDQIVDGDLPELELFRAGFETSAIRHQRLRIRGGMHGELRRVEQRLPHTLADQLAYALDRDALDLLRGAWLRDAWLRDGGRRSGRACQVGQGHPAADTAPHGGNRAAGGGRGPRRGGKCRTRRGGGNHVTLDDAAPRPAAAQRGAVDPQLRGPPAGARGR